MGWIRKTPRGRWRASYRDPDRATVSKTHDRKADAERWLRLHEGKIDEGTYIDPRRARTSFERFWPAFLAGSDIRLSTRDLYERMWRLYLAEHFGRRSLGSVTPTDVRAWIVELRERGTGEATLRACVLLFKTILNRAVDDELIPRNPARKIETPSAGTGEMHFLSHEQVEWLAAAMPERYRALVYLLAYGGVRIGEAAALTVDKLDLLRGRVTVEVALVEVAGHVHIGPTKTGNVRTVRIPSFLREMLARHIEHYVGRGGYVFSAPEGGPLRPNNFRKRVFYPAVRAAQLSDGLRVHDLRHTCAAFLVAQGAHAKVIADQLGHSSPVVTMKVYAHVLPGLAEAVTDGLEEAFQKARSAAAADLAAPVRPRGVSALPIGRTAE